MSDKYFDEIRLFIFLMGPIACIISIHRFVHMLRKKDKTDKVCFDCVKNPMEKGCPSCNNHLDFIILFNTLTEISLALTLRLFDKIFSIDLLESSDVK